MKSLLLRRGLMGIAFALPLMFITVAISSAQPRDWGPHTQAPDCTACHTEFVSAWRASAHADAAQTAAFLEAWTGQREPAMCLGCHATEYETQNGEVYASGIECASCHQPVNEAHPIEPMPVERSPDLCGECHQETHFAWSVSPHSIACIDCHDPHGTSLKAADASALCTGCHREPELTEGQIHPVHTAEGLTCADCHLGVLEEHPTEAHAGRDHSFHVQLTTCTDCHESSYHAALDNGQVQPPEPPFSMGGSESGLLQDTPSPASPFGYALLSGLVGMAAGMILAPWLEGWYRRLRESSDA